MIRTAFKGFLIVSLALSLVSLCVAEETEEPTIPSTLSGTYSGGNEGKAIDSGYDVFKEDPNPISGSVSVHGNTLHVTVVNNTDNQYRVSLRLVQYGDRGNTVKSDSFSYTLNGHDTKKRTVPRRATTKHEELKVENWKLLKSAKPEKEETK